MLGIVINWWNAVCAVLLVVAAYNWGGWKRGWWKEWRRKPR
jgi:hypothetical protein